MKRSNVIKEGEWFCAIEGLAIAERIYKIYFEEYDRIPQDKKIGDLNMSVVQYRLFCDFDGHPIKRNRFKYFNADYYLVFIYGDSIGKNILFNRLDFEIHERVN